MKNKARIKTVFRKMKGWRTRLFVSLFELTVIAMLAQNVSAQEKVFDAFDDYQGLVLDDVDNALTPVEPKL